MKKNKEKGEGKGEKRGKREESRKKEGIDLLVLAQTGN